MNIELLNSVRREQLLLQVKTGHSRRQKRESQVGWKISTRLCRYIYFQSALAGKRPLKGLPEEIYD